MSNYGLDSSKDVRVSSGAPLAGQYDVVIVGAGLAGLAAASELPDARVLVLESESRAGGRVLTQAWDDVRVDLGACFAYHPSLVPPSNNPTLGTMIRERNPIGIQWGTPAQAAHLYIGATPWDCLEQLPLLADSRNALAQARQAGIRADVLPYEATLALNTFLKQIHPGEIGEYVPDRQGDAVADWWPDHWETGNAALVEAYLERLTTRIALGCSVESLEEDARGITVSFKRGPSSDQVSAQFVIVATPATAARKLVTPQDPACASFLSAVRYGCYTVVAFVLRDSPELAELRYVVLPTARMSLVMQQGTQDRQHRVLLCYYGDRASVGVNGLPDDALIAAARQELADLGLPGFRAEAIVWSRVQRWPAAATIISPDYVVSKRPEFVRATPRVFLAGDYLSQLPTWGYGMDDAVSTGRLVGGLVRSALASL